ncbi:L,D-transpeptidase family protein [Haloplasma contractile]|uniref:Isoquinoline 1-oxidoreductase protein n=1 Tax=Haloplasma contractile SSD-17B TaxID=1033810 RepID=U2EBH0_9MOLU|nr:LysM peptidoglycan-binding domain-containing protein [Haloplasma contractile]ERJ12141.1 isoquinoline 1-oxidoreductase protein [Haloplasma contractile SSD-17B]
MNNRQCKTIITIKSGDTLGNLAVAYNTTVGAILAANKDLDPNDIVIGQDICIPETKDSVCPIGSIPYKIKAGETLSSIATEYKTTYEQLLLSNPDLNPSNLSVGTVICITQPKLHPTICPSNNIYVIQEGDAFYKIANTFGVSIDELLRNNPKVDPSNLEVDQVICLPLTRTPYIIVIDLDERKINLYYLGRFSKSYPIAIGKPTTPTPVGGFRIFNKQVQPGGPFGTRWMGLSAPSYGIHGTNTPESIGTASSNGCIRMYNRDVEELFSVITINTPVIID